jgi:hypothetical protein
MKRFEDYPSNVQERALVAVAKMSRDDKRASALEFIYTQGGYKGISDFSRWNLECAAQEESIALTGANSDEIL